MKLSLSKLEIKALQVICHGESTVSVLANALSISKSLASRIVTNLAKLNLVNIQREGVKKQISLSQSSGAESFRSLYFHRQNAKIENWLSGKTIELLIVIAHRPITIKELLRGCNCSRPTIYKVLKKLGAVGVVNKENQELKITDNLVKDFSQAFASNIQHIITKNVGEFDIISRLGKHCLIRTKTELKPPFYLTGVSKMFELGLQGLLTDYKDYYFALDEKQVSNLSLEEVIVHSLIMSREHFDTDKTLITIFLKQNSKKINWFELNKLAKRYGVNEKLGELRQAIDLHEKLNEYE